MDMKMEVINKEDIDVMAEITMYLREWKELRALLKDQHMGSLGDFKRQIDSMISGLEKHFYPEEGEE